MLRNPNIEVIEETDDLILLRDVGPWDEHLTITNGAEVVVEVMASMLDGRRLEYIDSMGERTRLLVEDGRFAGFETVKEQPCTRD